MEDAQPPSPFRERVRERGFAVYARCQTF